MLIQNDYKAQFINLSSESLKQQQSDNKSAEAITYRLIDSLSKAAKVVLQRENAPKVDQIWKDDVEFNDLLQRRSNAAKSSLEYKKLSTLIKARVRKLKNKKIAQRSRGNKHICN